MSAACCREVAALHRFFEDWFLGRCEADEQVWRRLEASLDPDFVLIGPDGQRQPRAKLLPALRSQHAARADDDPGFRLWTRACQARELTSGLWLVEYEEWQQRAGVTTRRVSSALMREQASAPGGLAWLWVHETWLPAPASRPSG